MILHEQPGADRRIGRVLAPWPVLAVVLLAYLLPILPVAAATSLLVGTSRNALVCTCRDGDSRHCPHCRRAACPACSKRLATGDAATAVPEQVDQRHDAPGRQVAVLAQCVCGGDDRQAVAPQTITMHLGTALRLSGRCDGIAALACSTERGGDLWAGPPPEKIPI